MYINIISTINIVNNIKLLVNVRSSFWHTKERGRKKKKNTEKKNEENEDEMPRVKRQDERGR